MSDTKTVQELQALMRDIEWRLPGKTLLLAICDDDTGECAASVGGSAILLTYLLAAIVTILENECISDDSEAETNGNAPSVRTIQ
jgi:hypothetical protein